LAHRKISDGRGKSEPIEPFVESIQVSASVWRDDNDIFDPNSPHCFAVESGLYRDDISREQLRTASRQEWWLVHFEP
jgi:hypothetical protein